jgi:quinol monooxygenase YgiN
MIGVIATLRVQDGKTAEFERVFAGLAAAVRANEAGNIAYQLCRSRSEANTYKVLELYRDEDALKAHGAADHFKAAGPALGTVLAGRPEVEYLDALG